jgi:hypothetical protein
LTRNASQGSINQQIFPLIEERNLSELPGPPLWTRQRAAGTGYYEQVLHDLAAEQGVDLRYFQEVTWAGAQKMKRGSYQAKPMIQIVNEAIERTHRITGLDHEAIVDGMVRGTIPIYRDGGRVQGDDP